MDKTTPATSKPPSAAAVSITSPAKVNLILRILDRRPDGYHNLWSLMQTVALHDHLTLALDSRPGIRLSCTHPAVPLGPANLIHRAAEAVFSKAGRSVGATIHLTKRIPMGAGLGGGSSNAAATVVGLNHLLQLGWSAQEMADLTHTLGSDVPFFYWAPTGKVSGRGERVQSIEITGRRVILLVNPGFGVETAWAYRALAAGRTQAPELPETVERLERASTVTWESLMPLMGNDFEAVVFPKHPVLAAIKARLLEAGAESAFLSGTGATVFGVFTNQEAAGLAQREFADQPTWLTVVVPLETAPLEATLTAISPEGPASIDSPSVNSLK